MTSLLKASLVAGSLLLALPLVSSPWRPDQVIVEKKARYIPAGSGQTPFDVTRHIIRIDEIQGGGRQRTGFPHSSIPLLLARWRQTEASKLKT